MKEIEFQCKRDNLTVYGLQILPEDYENKKLPAIIASHGFTDNLYGMKGFCDELAKEGYACFAMNFCGGGRENEPDFIKRDGDSRDMTISSEVADLCAVIDYVSSLEYIDKDNITLFGGSQGGFVSGIAAAKLGSKIKNLMMLFPALCIPEHARRGCLGGGSYDPENVPDEIRCAVTTLGRKMHEDVCDMDPYVVLPKYQGNVLLLQGTKDNIVDYSYAIRLKQSYRPDQCSFQLINDMPHGTNKEQTESVLASIRQFLNGRKQVFDFRIILSKMESHSTGNKTENDIFFSGYTESPLFTGVIKTDGVDHQVYVDGKEESICADYTFEGKDGEGQLCKLHVINRRGEKDWEPKIETDSKALAWVNDTKFTAVLEYDAIGPRVRVFK